MSEELLGLLYEVDKTSLAWSIRALSHFKFEKEFVYPLNESDYHLAWTVDKKPDDIERMRVEMEVLWRAGLIRRDEVRSRIPYNGKIMVYELNEKGKEIFEKMFNAEPMMCDGRHYARTH